MKKAHLVGIYISVVMTILTLNRLFIMSGFEPGEDPAPRRGAPQKPLLNEAQAVSPPSPLQRDPDLVKNWALKDDSALSIHKAWQLGQCDERVVVAVIDTGVDYNHPDLKQNIWKNPVEIEGNGKDDDKNGYVDDTMGWDFVGNDPLPYDDHGHGTHVTGIIGAASSNGIGISGVCPNVRLMILKYYDADADGKTNLKNTVRALHYAVDNGANIINYSGGGAEFSKEEYQAIEKASQKGILVIAAAGNEKQNADQHAYYPASYDLENIVSIAAVTQAKTLVESSNYGIKKIDIAAPGKSIYSTLPQGRYGYMTGTSQSTAFVSGIAALALSKNRSLTVDQLKELLIASIDPQVSLRGKIKTGGVINAHTLLKHIY